MLKISQAGTARRSVTLKLEGRVVGPWVGELKQICETHLDQGRTVQLDLTDVLYVDADGLRVLTGFKSRGVRLNNGSPFLHEQLRTNGAD